MVFLTCSESFSTITCRYFSKWRLKIFWGGKHLSTFELWRLTLPHLRGVPPGFFDQNDRKGCKRDVLDARGHFLLHFCAAGDKPSGGGGNHPDLGRTRVKCNDDDQDDDNVDAAATDDDDNDINTISNKVKHFRIFLSRLVKKKYKILVLFLMFAKNRKIYFLKRITFS